MRTDSTFLSDEILNSTGKYINEKYGKEFYEGHRKYSKNTESDVRHVNKFLGLLALEIWYRLFITNDLDSNTKLEL